MKFQSSEQDPKDVEEFDQFIKSRFEESELFEEFSRNRLEASKSSSPGPLNNSTPIFRRTYSIKRDEKKYSYITQLDKLPAFVSKDILRPQRIR